MLEDEKFYAKKMKQANEDSSISILNGEYQGVFFWKGNIWADIWRG